MGLRPRPTDKNEKRENDFRQSGRGWKPPHSCGGKERSSAPGKVQIPIVRFSAGMADSRAKQAAEKRAEATSEAQDDV